MTPPIVVTGASGFVGRHLVRHLARRGLSTVALSRQTGTAYPTTVVQSEVVAAYADYQPQAGSVLIHLAEPPHIGSVDARGQAHIAQMKQQASALLARNYRRAIYVSSATVYGDTSDAPWESDRPVVESPKIYAQSKLAVEKLILAASGTVARLTNLYGPGMANTTIFADILSQLGREGPVVIREATPIRDYLWIDDAASALAAMALYEHRGVYNVASGSAISCGDLASLILSLAGEGFRPIEARQPARHSVLRIDTEKTKREFHWRPKVDLEAGVRMLLKPEQK